MGWLSKKKQEPVIVSKEGTLARIGSQSPDGYSIWLVLLEGESAWTRLEAAPGATRQIDDPLTLSKPGDRVEFTLREYRPGYGVCLHFVNFTLESELTQARIDAAERAPGHAKTQTLGDIAPGLAGNWDVGAGSVLGDAGRSVSLDPNASAAR